MYEIYLYTCQISDKIYVGKTRQGLSKRDKQHMYEVRTGSLKLFHLAVRKYGRERFTLEVLQKVETLKEANERETFWISHLKATDKTVGYNITLGGDGVDDPSGEAYRKIAAATTRHLAIPENNGCFRHDVPTSEVIGLYAGMSGSGIAAHFGVSESCIYRRLAKAGVPVKTDFANYDKEIFQLYKIEEYTSSEVAKILGISPSKVSKSLNKQGVVTRTPGTRPRYNRAVQEREEKKCPTCHGKKPISEYYPNSKSLDGLSYQCKMCDRIKNKESKAKTKQKKDDGTYVKKFPQKAYAADRTDKKCSECQIIKPVDDFYVSKRSHDGRSGLCKECDTKSSRKRRKGNATVSPAVPPSLVGGDFSLFSETSDPGRVRSESNSFLPELHNV